MSDKNESFPRPAVGAVVIHEKRILLVKRLNPPQQGRWAVPGGTVKAGESLQEAAEREVSEETGITIRAGDPVHTFDIIDRDAEGRILFHYIIVDVRGEYLSGSPRPGDDADDARWFSRRELQGISLTETMRALLRKVGW